MKTITIKQGGIGRYDDVSPFLAEDGALALHFVLPRVSGEFFAVLDHPFADGRSQRVEKIPASGDVEIAGLCAGELDAVVKHYLRGELIEEFPVEPLLIKRVDGSVRAIPEIAEIERRIDELERRAEELADSMKETFGRAATLEHARDVSFLKFAYAEYQSDVQLNAKGLTAAEFISALGFGISEFTREELGRIEKFKEEL